MPVYDAQLYIHRRLFRDSMILYKEDRKDCNADKQAGNQEAHAVTDRVFYPDSNGRRHRHADGLHRTVVSNPGTDLVFWKQERQPGRKAG